MLEKNFVPSFSAYNALKGAEIVAEAAKEGSLQLDIAQAGLKRFERVVNEGHGDKDMAASYLVTEGKNLF
ncbi:NAD(P)-dependent oxidoreductase [Tetragenococcus koreensis]|uniref:NAD(P)-dependent oxidoreductase n=1 Tax=Tetragenococcus koreensis TaxID=290335 RepID=UPI000F4E30A3|nr:NAD(P)-dependent oxidoreductase [Tetragenococcus koreensis]AYW45284.1 hypothetical protein C7K43_04625 [Tetragenococcus koreensis]MCF1619491.1 NAD(P)-dependent oxidoreductase [Tetragenococcus koreensis]MCF1656973.1 NAD(P)-dependent oxidoreductase [Tetragenococcus koreensis]GEN90289.1 hypothetical protein TKO01_03350 [Tetragenococcus koreensis]